MTSKEIWDNNYDKEQFVEVTTTRHNLLKKAFEYLHKLNQESRNSDDAYSNLMQDVLKIVAPIIGTENPLQKHIRFLCKNTYDCYAKPHTIPMQKFLRSLCKNTYDSCAKT